MNQSSKKIYQGIRKGGATHQYLVANGMHDDYIPGYDDGEPPINHNHD